MARMLLLALGSRGDVQPFVALASGLRAAGHDVVLATPAGFEKLASGRGFTHVEVMSSPETVLGTPDDDLFGAAKRHPVREARRMLAGWFAQMEEVMAAIPEAGQGADLVLWWEPLANFGRHLAEALGVPGVAAGLNPENWMSSTIPEPALPWPPDWLPPSVRGAYIRMGHATFLQVTASLYRSRVNRWRRDVLHLPELPRRASAAEKVAAPVLRLSGVSSLVRELPPEWRERTINTGYWMLPPDESWTMPADLQAFLDAGPPPVFASMGTAVKFPPSLAPTVLEAARRAGMRLVLGSGWHGRGGLDEVELPPEVIDVGDIPHERVFPSMAGVIHHGGGGSTGAAFRAGVPSVALPVFADQPFWGRQIARLGVGPEPIWVKKASVENLAAVMRGFRDDVAMSERAAELGRHLRDEDGIARAVEAIESLLPDALVPARRGKARPTTTA